ncbi:hypothetical protein DL96DRAFT_1781103 [Flagelloscypha sp. PMI_526]|nr:hypothetical protein DL96DRAFT_1781103 [Flagelloscypha sp. PMI_526]
MTSITEPIATITATIVPSPTSTKKVEIDIPAGAWAGIIIGVIAIVLVSIFLCCRNCCCCCGERAKRRAAAAAAVPRVRSDVGDVERGEDQIVTKTPSETDTLPPDYKTAVNTDSGSTSASTGKVPSSTSAPTKHIYIPPGAWAGIIVGILAIVVISIFICCPRYCCCTKESRRRAAAAAASRSKLEAREGRADRSARISTRTEHPPPDYKTATTTGGSSAPRSPGEGELTGTAYDYGVVKNPNEKSLGRTSCLPLSFSVPPIHNDMSSTIPTPIQTTTSSPTSDSGSIAKKQKIATGVKAGLSVGIIALIIIITILYCLWGRCCGRKSKKQALKTKGTTTARGKPSNMEDPERGTNSAAATSTQTPMSPPDYNSAIEMNDVSSSGMAKKP